MHPYFFATLLVGTVAVAYGAYIIFKEISEEPILLHNTRGREGCHNSDDEDSIVESEKNGLRKRKVKRENNDEEEQELLDKYSYLTALEQEIERKKKQLDDEERILYEKEQEIQNRKQHLQSMSSQSSSNSCEISPLTTQRKASISSSVTSASEVIVNDYHDKSGLTEEILPVVSNPPQSVISVKTVSSDENDQPNNKSSDVAAHTILSQHLSHITHQQQTPNPSIIVQNSGAPADSTTNPSLISEHNDHSAGYHQQHSYPVNNSHFVAKSVASEETWSEVDSVLSENIGSVMSSAVDIDMEEVDVIEH